MSIRNEISHAINGVEGRLSALHSGAHPGCFSSQVWHSVSRPIKGYGAGSVLTVEISFDDACRNKHNTFNITAEVRRSDRSDVEACGCLHDDIAAVFKELRPLIKWHGVHTDAPLHYVANTVYHASDLKEGKAAGEPNCWSKGFKFGTSPLTWTPKSDAFYKFLDERQGTGEFQIVTVPYVRKPGDTYDFSPHYAFAGFGDNVWHEAPFSTLAEACEVAAAFQGDVSRVTQVTGYSPGKERELDHARSSAVWPEATDEQLCLPAAELPALLNARLPALMTAFRADVEAAGLLWAA